MEKDHSWQLYTSSESAWEAMLAAIKGARASIDLEQYIFENDEVCRPFIEALCERAKNGIKVRMLCDHVGSIALSGSKEAHSLLGAGVELKFFNSIMPWSPNNEALWYFRDHRKLLIVDQALGFTGGICVSKRMRGWRDSTVEISGPVVYEMTLSFEDMWKRNYKKLKYYFRNHGISRNRWASFRFISNAPLPDGHHLYKEFIRAVKGAKHYIHLTTPYFLPDSRLLRNLKRAVRRGVDVRIVVPHTTNYKVLDVGMGTFFRDLLLHGVRIFRYPKERFIHAKTAVIDGSWAMIGSMNLDNLSLRYNFEGSVVSDDAGFAKDLETQFAEDEKEAAELTFSEWEARPFIRKLLEILVWPIRKFL